MSNNATESLTQPLLQDASEEANADVEKDKPQKTRPKLDDGEEGNHPKQLSELDATTHHNMRNEGVESLKDPLDQYAKEQTIDDVENDKRESPLAARSAAGSKPVTTLRATSAKHRSRHQAPLGAAKGRKKRHEALPGVTRSAVGGRWALGALDATEQPHDDVEKGNCEKPLPALDEAVQIGKISGTAFIVTFGAMFWKWRIVVHHDSSHRSDTVQNWAAAGYVIAIVVVYFFYPWIMFPYVNERIRKKHTVFEEASVWAEQKNTSEEEATDTEDLDEGQKKGSCRQLYNCFNAVLRTYYAFHRWLWCKKRRGDSKSSRTELPAQWQPAHFAIIHWITAFGAVVHFLEAEIWIKCYSQDVKATQWKLNRTLWSCLHLPHNGTIVDATTYQEITHWQISVGKNLFTFGICASFAAVLIPYINLLFCLTDNVYKKVVHKAKDIRQQINWEVCASDIAETVTRAHKFWDVDGANVVVPLIVVQIGFFIFAWMRAIDQDLKKDLKELNFEATKNDFFAMTVVTICLYWLLRVLSMLSDAVSAKALVKLLMDRKRAQNNANMNPNSEVEDWRMALDENIFLTKVNCLNVNIKLYGFRITKQSLQLLAIKGLIALPVVTKLAWAYVNDQKSNTEKINDIQIAMKEVLKYMNNSKVV